MDAAKKKKKDDRLDLRISSDDKRKIQRAMEILGVSSTAEFILKRVMPDVERALAQEKKIRLNAQSWDAFLSLLETPKTASSSLKEAMNEYRDTQGV